MKHSRTFEFELFGASDTVSELSEYLVDIDRSIGDVPHRITSVNSVNSVEFRHSQYGTVGHRYTVLVEVLR